MISELKKAVEKAEKLSEKEQKVIAQLIVDEINWNKSLTDSSSTLDNLSSEALEEYKKGKTKPLQL
jgi:hypothetical protein